MKKSIAGRITLGAIIAAVYAASTILFAPFSYGLMQVRISEALTVLPFLFPEAVPGLFVGCLIANLYGGNPLDIIFGSLATLLAAFLTSRIKNKWLAPLPPVICNAVIVGSVLTHALIGTPDEVHFLVAWLSVGVGELIACYVLGLPLLAFIKRFKRG